MTQGSNQEIAFLKNCLPGKWNYLIIDVKLRGNNFSSQRRFNNEIDQSQLNLLILMS